MLADSTTYDFGPHDDACDLVFVDGSHRRDAVRSDSLNAWRICRRDGIVLWHDYGASYGVTAAFNALIRSDQRFAPMGHIAGMTLGTLHKT